LFLISGRKDPVEARMLEYVGDFSDYDLVQYWVIENFQSAGDMRKFRCVRLDACLEDFEAEQLVRFIKAEPPTLSHPEIFDLQGTNLQAAIKSSSSNRPLLVFFLAPWCSACHRFNAVYEGSEFVAFAKDKNIILARIDVAGNDTPGISVLSYPALRLFRGPEVVDAFNGDLMSGVEHVQFWLSSFAS
jgi:thioredoxin-like negative regulator of GroEL